MALLSMFGIGGDAHGKGGMERQVLEQLLLLAPLLLQPSGGRHRIADGANPILQDDQKLIAAEPGQPVAGAREVPQP